MIAWESLFSLGRLRGFRVKGFRAFRVLWFRVQGFGLLEFKLPALWAQGFELASASRAAFRIRIGLDVGFHRDRPNPKTLNPKTLKP